MDKAAIIDKVVCDEYKEESITNKSKKRDVAEKRFIAMDLLS